MIPLTSNENTTHTSSLTLLDKSEQQHSLFDENVGYCLECSSQRGIARKHGLEDASKAAVISLLLLKLTELQVESYMPLLHSQAKKSELFRNEITVELDVV